MRKYNVAVVGATGVVGRKMLQVLAERQIPVENLYPMATAKSAGKIINWGGKDFVIEELTEASFDKDIDFALFSAGGETSLRFSPIAAAKGVTVIDNSSAFRMHEDVPLVVPEVNGATALTNKGIIANPNCSTIQAVVALKPLYDAYGLKRVVYSTYQAVSGSGRGGILDLENGIKGIEPSFYPAPIAYNVLPHIDSFTDNGYTKEEIKMINETHKILGDYDIAVTATTVRVPVYYCHSESINAETLKAFDMEEVFKLYRENENIHLVDDSANAVYPTPLKCADTDDVYVGRLRRDFSVENGVNMWVVSDNLRKGAATNAVQIAHYLIENNYFDK